MDMAAEFKLEFWVWLREERGRWGLGTPKPRAGWVCEPVPDTRSEGVGRFWHRNARSSIRCWKSVGYLLRRRWASIRRIWEDMKLARADEGKVMLDSC